MQTKKRKDPENYRKNGTSKSKVEESVINYSNFMISVTSACEKEPMIATGIHKPILTKSPAKI